MAEKLVYSRRNDVTLFAVTSYGHLTISHTGDVQVTIDDVLVKTIRLDELIQQTFAAFAGPDSSTFAEREELRGKFRKLLRIIEQHIDSHESLDPGDPESKKE